MVRAGVPTFFSWDHDTPSVLREAGDVRGGGGGGAGGGQERGQCVLRGKLFLDCEQEHKLCQRQTQNRARHPRRSRSGQTLSAGSLHCWIVGASL
jgi:hypothetical protein